MPPKQKQSKSKNSRKQRKQAKPKKNSMAVTARPRAPRLSHCAMKFALACLCPFDPRAFGACNPSGREAYTQKTHSIQRLNMVIGSGGLGFVSIAPSLANDATNCFYSTSGYIGISTTPLVANNVLNSGVSVSTPNLPYNTAVLASSADLDSEQVNGRIVAVGLKVTYIGTELNMGGMYFGLTDPNHFTVDSATDANIGTFQQAKIVPVTRKPVTITAYPIDNSEDAMSSAEISSSILPYVYPYNTSNAHNTTYKGPIAYSYATPGGASMGGCIMTIVATGTPNNTFLVEIITHVEYGGQLAQNMLSVAHTDVQGAATVKHAVGQTEAIFGGRSATDAEKWGQFARKAYEITDSFTRGFFSRSDTNLMLTDS